MSETTERRKSVLLREILFPIITGITVGIILGVVSAFGTTYMMATVLEQRVKTLEQQHLKYSQYVDQITDTQVQLATIITKQQAFLGQLDDYVTEVRKIQEQIYSVRDTERSFKSLEKRVELLSSRVEKYH